MFFNIFLSTLIFFLPENSRIIAKTNVRSAIFDQNNVANQNSGSPCKTESIDTIVSGKMEIIDTTISPIIYLENLNHSARCHAYFVASIAPLITKRREPSNNSIFMAIIMW